MQKSLRSRFVVTWSITTLTVASQSYVAAQSKDAACQTCEVQLVRVQAIPSAISSTVIRHNPSIVFSNEAYILAPAYGGAVAVFRNRTFKTIGRLGGGPGEFRDEIPLTMSAGADGGVYIVHGPRVSIIDTRKNIVSSSFRLPYSPVSLAPLGKAVLVTSFGSNDIEAFDLTGRALWKHKSPIPLKQSDALQVATSGDTAYWSTSLYSYEARLIRRDGTVIKTVRRQPVWFKSNGMVVGEPLHVRPTPKVAGVLELANGLLLFVINVADSQWKAGPARGLPIDKMRPDEYYDTILEIVDSKDSRLITSARYDQAVHLLRGSKYVWLLKEAADGESFEIFEPRLGR